MSQAESKQPANNKVASGSSRHPIHGAIGGVSQSASAAASIKGSGLCKPGKDIVSHLEDSFKNVFG